MPKHEDILEALRSRDQWEKRQSTWYQMRHDGLRRRVKPFPNAADMHFALADMLIEKLKPYYVQQVFAMDTVGTFYAQNPSLSLHAAGAAQWFDYQVKQRSNFEREITTAVDIMLQTGKGVKKVMWDTQRKRLRFETINPLYIVVPPWTDKLEEADWIVHIQHFSKASYRERKDFEQSEELIALIAGEQQEGAVLETEKYEREGLTKPKSGDQIIIWEVFSREDGKWRIDTYSPSQPARPVRAPFKLPYERGPFADGWPPFVEFNCETKEKGFYSSRGICERVAPFEAALCKDWNTQKDYQTLTCSPVFYAKDGLAEGTNVRMTPGEILPFEIAAVQFPQIPFDLQQQMIGTREMAEQLVAMPSAGASQQLNIAKARTATEMSIAAAQQGQSVDLRARVFRRELGSLLNLAWAILVQYAAESLSYYYRDDLLELDAAAISDAYRIEPSGSGDNSNKQLQAQKAVARFQMFNNDPMIDQRALRRTVIESDDPRMVKQLLLDEGTQQAEQLEDQAQEISILLLFFPAQVKPTDDDGIHLSSITQYAQRVLQQQENLTPEQWLMLAAHAQQHLSQFKKKNPQAFAQQAGQFMPFWQQIQQQAQVESQRMAIGRAAQSVAAGMPQQPPVGAAA